MAVCNVVKIWLYAVSSVLLGSLAAPWVYNAGKALAEVSASKRTNDLIAWLAGGCERASFEQFYVVSLFLAAAILFLPLAELLRGRSSVAGRRRPWSLRLPENAHAADRGQRLIVNPAALVHLLLGFFTIFGMLVIVHGMHLLVGDFVWQNPAQSVWLEFLKWLSLAVLIAAIQELIFRGIAMGIFLRAMRPAAALGVSALLFAGMHFMIPAAGLQVADPNADGTGFELLGKVLAQFSELQALITHVIPWLALGGVLAFARWRTASLWLPIGIHAGWIFSGKLSQEFTLASQSPASHFLQQGLLPVVALLITGVFIHYLTAPAADAAEIAA